jgi:hypothetical protein
MTMRIRLGCLAIAAAAIALLAGCAVSDEPTATHVDGVAIAPDVFATSADGEVANQTVLLTGTFGSATAAAALQSAGDRYMLVDETGVEHASVEAAQGALDQGLYTPNYVADPLITARGMELYVDTKGWIPEPMRLTFVRILGEELAAAGLTDVTVVAAPAQP